MNRRQDSSSQSISKSMFSRKLNWLFWGNLAAALLHLASFVAALCVILITEKRIPVLVSTDFTTVTNDIVSVDSNVSVFNGIVWLIIAVPIITSLFHFLIVILRFVVFDFSILKTPTQAVRYANRCFQTYSQRPMSVFSSSFLLYYRNAIVLGVNPLRWLEYSISSSIMIIVISLLAGISNAFLLIAQAFLNIGLMVVGGFYFEVDNIGYRTFSGKSLRKVRWRFFLIGCLIFLIQWLPIFTYFFTAVSSSKDLPWFVYAVILVLFALFTLFAANALFHYLSIPLFKDFVKYEIYYIFLSFTAKFALDWILIVGVLSERNDLQVST